MNPRHLIVIGVLMLLGGSLGAQVGYPPERSPFRDLPETMEASMYSGWFKARKDPGGVAPRSGPMVGALYQWRMGGPSNLTVDLARVASERQVLDPERLATCAGPTPTSPPDTSVACKSLGT
jgi:hypothetical protein